MKTPNTTFILFEFDKEVQTLWQSMATGAKRFAYHQRLASLIHAEPNWTTDLNSLKVLDVFLSAVKSDLASKNVSEGRVLAHDDFARLITVLLYHVVQVVEHTLEQSVALTPKPKPTTTIYTAEGFSRVYARLFSSMGMTHGASELTDEELDGFYYGLGLLCQGVGGSGQAVADSFFVLPIIGARLFGSIDRTFMAGLDHHGQGHGVAEDSLYWAVHDFIENFKNTQHSTEGDDHAKQLFQEHLTTLMSTNTEHVEFHGNNDDIGTHMDADIDNIHPTNPAQEPHQFYNSTDISKTSSSATYDVLQTDLPTQPKPDHTQSADIHTQSEVMTHAMAPKITADAGSSATSQPSSQNPIHTPNTNQVSEAIHANTTKLAPSAYKQRARASHTPKLFDEAYQDLQHLNMPSDTVSDYQKAAAVLIKFDTFIDGELAKGKTLTELTFNDKQQQARKQALTLLVNLVKQGNPSAMLRLALYYFGGRGVNVDVARAIMLTKRAAEMGDMRAQKLLSRLYYQGFEPNHGGMAMDVAMGEHWLRKAADNGHPEAKKVCAYMNQVEVLKDDYRAEVVSDKRYGMLFLCLGVGTVLLFILLSIIW